MGAIKHSAFILLSLWKVNHDNKHRANLLSSPQAVFVCACTCANVFVHCPHSELNMLFSVWIDDCCCSLQQGKETQLLHVFEEDLILGGERTESTRETPISPHTGINKIVFSNSVFLDIFKGFRPSSNKLIVTLFITFTILCVCVCFLTASSQLAFSARFFLVVVELTPTGRSLLHMWHLHLAARPVTMGECFEQKTWKSTGSRRRCD